MKKNALKVKFRAIPLLFIALSAQQALGHSFQFTNLTDSDLAVTAQLGGIAESTFAKLIKKGTSAEFKFLLGKKYFATTETFVNSPWLPGKGEATIEDLLKENLSKTIFQPGLCLRMVKYAVVDGLNTERKAFQAAYKEVDVKFVPAESYKNLLTTSKAFSEKAKVFAVTAAGLTTKVAGLAEKKEKFAQAAGTTKEVAKTIGETLGKVDVGGIIGDVAELSTANLCRDKNIVIVKDKDTGEIVFMTIQK